MLTLIHEAQRHGWESRLWALDEVHPSLASFSLGEGRGTKFSLLNSLLNAGGWSDFEWIIVTDDDVELEQGSLNAFLRVSAEAGFCLAQPAHGQPIHVSHAITVAAPFSIARLTTYVEIGPLFAAHRSLFDLVLPFPEGYGMGWGVDILWSDLARAGARLGIVDLVSMRHLMPVARQYATSPERERLQELVRERGARSILELQRTLGVWRPWQRRPGWISTSGAD